MPLRYVSAVVTVLLGITISPSTSFSQVFNARDFLRDFIIVQQEEAEAKRVRLEWITRERDRIHGELKKYEQELSELNSILPDPVKPRQLPPAVATARRREQITFNNFSANNDPGLNGAVRSGDAINALVRILGPIAHCRKMRSAANPDSSSFPSLSDACKVRAEDANHFRLSSGSVTNSNVIHRPNQLPLDLNWPTLLTQEWPVECKDIEKLRNEYVRLLSSPPGPTSKKRVECADLLDSALELLQAMVLREKNKTPHNPTLSPQKKVQRQGELRQSVNYLATIRASAEEFKQAPTQFMVHEFNGGTIEDFLDFCYTRGMVFKTAMPDDRVAYFAVYKKMQDYAQDVQHIEDWKDDIQNSIKALSQQDQQLVIEASTQTPVNIIVD